LGNAADAAGLTDLQNRALGRFIQLGQNTPEYHLLMGKALLNRGENDKAIPELQQAARQNPTLPFVHFNLGLAYLAQRDLGAAEAEFLQDIAIEPDVAFDFDRLGTVYYFQQQDAKAEANYLKAIKLDPHLASSYLGLAHIYLHQQKFREALKDATYAERADSENSDCHYTRGQVLIRLGRTVEGRAELAAASRILKANRDRLSVSNPLGNLPQPELTSAPPE